MERVKTQILLKRNLKALIKFRGKTQGGLARYLRRKGQDDKDADSWISHILDEHDLTRELPLELWDRAVEYLGGVDTYHLLIPGIVDNESTERRSGRERRQRADRRLGTALPATERQLDLMNLIRALPHNCVEEAIVEVMKVLDRAIRRRRGTAGSAGGQGSTGETDGASHAPTHTGKKKRQA